MPRPRFTLRVILAVTAIAAVMAWQYSIVLRRRVAMDSEHRFILATPAPGYDPHNLATINPLRELLGDQPVQFIYVDSGDDAADDMERLKVLFPEAGIGTTSPYEW